MARVSASTTELSVESATWIEDRRSEMLCRNWFVALACKWFPAKGAVAAGSSEGELTFRPEESSCMASTSPWRFPSLAASKLRLGSGLTRRLILASSYPLRGRVDQLSH